MSKKLFTDDEMLELKASIYVVDVIPSHVFFSAAFKSMFYAKYKDGMRAEDIIREAGIRPELLGKTRIDGIRQVILKRAREGRAFTDGNIAQAVPMCRTDAEHIAMLKHELAYIKQENEFLKKIISAGNPEQK